MADHIVTHAVCADGRTVRDVIRQNGAEAALAYSVVTPQLVIADHTDVPDVFRGTGAGLALAARLVADARARGFKIVPLSAFAHATRRKHRNGADAFEA